MNFCIDYLMGVVHHAKYIYGKSIKQIKIKTILSDYLAAEIKPYVAADISDSGCIDKFTGIPIIVDDTIDGLYELEYEED